MLSQAKKDLPSVHTLTGRGLAGSIAFAVVAQTHRNKDVLAFLLHVDEDQLTT